MNKGNLPAWPGKFDVFLCLGIKMLKCFQIKARFSKEGFSILLNQKKHRKMSDFCFYVL